MYDVFGPKWHPKFHKFYTFRLKIKKMQLFETCTTYLVQNGTPNSIKVSLFGVGIMEMQFLRRVRRFWSKMASQIPRKGAWNHIFGPGRSKTSPAGPPGQPGRQRGTREERRRGAAHRRGWRPPPHSYHRRWVIW